MHVCFPNDSFNRESVRPVEPSEISIESSIYFEAFANTFISLILLIILIKESAVSLCSKIMGIHQNEKHSNNEI